MKVSTVFLLAIAALFAATSFYLWRELAAARDQLDDSAVVTRRLQARLGALEKASELPPRQSPAPQFAQARSSIPVPAAESTSTAPKSVGDTANQEPPRLQVHLDSPAMHRMARNQHRATMRRTYQDFVTDLGLTPEEANKLYDLLHEQQTRGFSAEVAANPMGVRQRWAELQRQKDAEIAALLGDSNLATLREYERTNDARYAVDAIRNQLAFAELPMSDAQRKRMIEAVFEDQQSNPTPPFAEVTSQEDLQRAQLARERAHTERMLSLARSILSAEQYQVYEDARRSELEMQEQALLNPGKDLVFSSGSMTVIHGGTDTSEATGPAPASQPRARP